MHHRRILLAGALLSAFASVLYAQTIRFAVLADSQGTGGVAVNETVFSELVQRVLEADPPVQFVLFPGDLVYGIWDSELMAERFATWRALAGDWYQSNMIGIKVYAIPGNHDLLNPSVAADLWRAAFPELPDNGPEDDKKLTYSFDVGPVHFAAVNTSHPLRNHRVDLEWLQADLAQSTAQFKFVYGHNPAYPIHRHIGSSLDAFPELRDQFWQILADHGVRAYFCGHLHFYDHWIKDNVHQIIAGSAGASANVYHYVIVDVDPQADDVTVTVHQRNGDVYQQYLLSDTEDVPHEDRIAPDRSILDLIPCVSLLLCVLALTALGFRSLAPPRGAAHE